MTDPFSALFFDPPATLEHPANILNPQDRQDYIKWLGTFEALFTPSPERWGYRGDPHLWRELTAVLYAVQLPKSVSGLLKILRTTFMEITGHRLANEGSLSIERFATGGMSSDLVSMDYWRGALWRELVSRFTYIWALRNEPTGIQTEKDLDLMLEHAIWTDASFLHWFLTECGLDVDDWKCAWSRADSPWTTVVNEKGEKSQGETDVLFVFSDTSGKRMALHIENKLASGVFEVGQAAQYPLRANKLSGKEKYGNYTLWRTVLVAPKSLVIERPDDADHFDVCLDYNDVVSRLPVAKGPIC